MAREGTFDEAANGVGGTAETSEGIGPTEWVPQPHRFARAVPVGLAVVGLAGISAYHNVATRHRIEGDLQEKARSKLAREFPGLTVKFDGRDATLEGPVPDPAALQRAHDLVRHIAGVRHVKDPKIDGATKRADTSARLSTETEIALPAATSEITTATTTATPTSTVAPRTTTATPTSTVAPRTTTATPTSTVAPTSTVVSTNATVPTTTLPLESPSTTIVAVEIPNGTSPGARPTGGGEAPTDLKGRLLFGVASSELTTDSASGIDELAVYLKANPDAQVGISGHSDRIGSKIANLAVSRARADAVRTALEARGIDASRITAFGYGARLPIASNATAEGRRLNRRVEVRFFGIGPGRDVAFTG